MEDLKLDRARRELKIGEAVIVLRNREYSLMEYFLMNVGRVISRTELLEDVWDKNIFCSTSTIDVHVSSLRRKLKRFSLGSCIKTIHCIGYMFDY